MRLTGGGNGVDGDGDGDGHMVQDGDGDGEVEGELSVLVETVVVTNLLEELAGHEQLARDAEGSALLSDAHVSDIKECQIGDGEGGLAPGRGHVLLDVVGVRCYLDGHGGATPSCRCILLEVLQGVAGVGARGEESRRELADSRRQAKHPACGRWLRANGSSVVVESATR